VFCFEKIRIMIYPKTKLNKITENNYVDISSRLLTK
jgi:hypothetical protein